MKKKIGQLIQERVKAEKMEVTAFARAIHKERSNAYDIFNRDNIDIKLLEKIGQVLNYDFFQDLLAPETKQKLVMRKGITKKVLVEIELTDDEIEFLNLEKKLINLK